MRKKLINQKFLIWLIFQFVLVFLLGVFIGIFIEKNFNKEESQHYNYSDLFVGEVNYIIVPVEKIIATVTAYNPTKEQCDETPEITASGKRVYSGVIACPRRYPFGTVVRIDDKWYICEDRTAKKYDGIFDVLMFDTQQAKEFGRQKKEVIIYY